MAETGSAALSNLSYGPSGIAGVGEVKGLSAVRVR